MARHLSTLICQGCNFSFTTSPRWAAQTKFCKLCQVIRDDEKHRHRMAKARKCSHCEREFWPIRAGQNWTRCGYCDHHALADCVRCACGNIARPAEGLTSSCLGCVQSTQQRRSEYIAHIKTIIDDRRETFLAENENHSQNVVHSPGD